MAIEKGRDWGGPGELPADAIEAASDAAIAEAVQAGATHVRPAHGDLATTLGVSPASLARPASTLLPIDALHVELDGDVRLAVAHVVVGSSRRPSLAAMNAAFLGQWNMAPRAHPGDGRVDVVDIDLGLVDWLKARRRLPTGTHVPHPGIEVRRVAEWAVRLEREQPVTLDGSVRHRAREIRIRVVDEAFVAGV